MILDLGCGSRKVEGAVGVDFSRQFSDCDVEWDLEKFPYPFPDGCADEIYLRDVLEHIYYPHQTVAECHRLLKAGGRLCISVPFMFPFHVDRHGNDFFRYTENALWVMLRDFSRKEIRAEKGKFLCAFRMLMPSWFRHVRGLNLWWLRMGKLLDMVFFTKDRGYVLWYKAEAVK